VLYESKELVLLSVHFIEKFKIDENELRHERNHLRQANGNNYLVVADPLIGITPQANYTAVKWRRVNPTPNVRYLTLHSVFFSTQKNVEGTTLYQDCKW